MGQAAAFFDMDKTVLAVNSGTLWLQHLVTHREITVYNLARALWWLALYQLALVDGEFVTAEGVSTVKGQREADMRRVCDRWFAEKVAPHITAGACARVAEHRAEGHLLAVLSSSSPYASEPLGAHLGIPHVLCTRLEVQDGIFTGGVAGSVCFGRGKVRVAEEFARERDVDFSASWFYTDSYSDLPMLARVGHPVAVNPDLRLRRHARARGWPILSWTR
ncbi:MAG: HAD family hydrolase [Deltaproteobacteria bacterium]|nr:HAD family hydrolase [Deltaproteobacteria bacterium]